MRMKLQDLFPPGRYNPKRSKRLPGKYCSFFISFLILSTAFYLIWTQFASCYFFLVLKTTTAYFEFIGIEVSFNPTPEFLYSQGIRSSIPPYIALILASNFLFSIAESNGRALPFKRKFDQRRSCYLSLPLSLEGKSILRGLIVGIPILFLFRVLLQISYVYLQISPTSEFYAIFVIFLSGTCRVALPFLLWLALTYRQILPPLLPRLEPEKPEKEKKHLKGKK